MHGGIVGTAVRRAAGITCGLALAGAALSGQDVLLAMRPAGAATPLALEGDVSGVVAGGPAGALRVTLRNSSAHDAGVGTVRADVTRGPGGCPLTIRAWTGDLTVPARGTASVTLPVSAPAGCGGARWALAYTAY
jgi:hypothetical protein